MDKDMIEELTARLDRLELENQWLKRLGAGLVCVMVAALGLGTNLGRSAHEITARSLALTDETGQVRARLGVRPDGAPTLALLNRRGEDQVVLRAGVDGSSSLDYFEGRTARATLSNSAGAGSSLSLFNVNSRTNARMFIDEAGGSGITFHRDLRGVAMNVDSNGTSELVFADRKGRLQQGLRQEPDGRLSLLGQEPVLRSVIETRSGGADGGRMGFGQSRPGLDLSTFQSL